MKREIGLALVVLPLVGLLALLGWAMVRAQGKSFQGFAINANFGEARVTKPDPADFSLTLLDGTPLTLQGLQGKPVMIDFWASWCPPCRQEAPMLAAVSKEYEQKGVAFLGIALWDSDEDARAFLARYGIGYPNGIDRQGTIAIDFGVTGIPEKYFLDKNGRITRRFIGPTPEERLREALDALLASAD